MANYTSNYTGEQIDGAVGKIVSNSATNGQVLTADGNGGAAWGTKDTIQCTFSFDPSTAGITCNLSCKEIYDYYVSNKLVYGVLNAADYEMQMEFILVGASVSGSTYNVTFNTIYNVQNIYLWPMVLLGSGTSAEGSDSYAGRMFLLVDSPSSRDTNYIYKATGDSSAGWCPISGLIRSKLYQHQIFLAASISEYPNTLEISFSGVTTGMYDFENYSSIASYLYNNCRNGGISATGYDKRSTTDSLIYGIMSDDGTTIKYRGSNGLVSIPESDGVTVVYNHTELSIIL